MMPKTAKVRIKFPPEFSNPMDKVTVSDVVRGIEIQSGGQLKAKDFTSIPCPDNRCAVLTYTIIKKGKITPINRIVDVGRIADYYAEPADYDSVLKATRKILCETNRGNIPCCPTSIGSLEGQYFSIGCHGLQDIWNIDLNRVKRCCVHELTIEGKLVPIKVYLQNRIGTAEKRKRNGRGS